MKKIRSLIALICSCLCLSACKSSIDNGNNFPKVELDYVESGHLIELQPAKFYEKAITKAESFVVYYSIDFCAACNDLSQQMKAYARKEHTNIYWINMTNISKFDYEEYIYKASIYANDAYQMPPYSQDMELNFPLMHIYSKTVIVLPINDSFVDKLIKYTTVTNAS